MVVQPAVQGCNTLMETWKDWQSFNAGMLAFLAAGAAIYYGYYKQYLGTVEAQSRANKALLPGLLDKTITAFKSSAEYFSDSISLASDTPLRSSPPPQIRFSDTEQDIIKGCIANTSDNFRNDLINFINEVQFLNSKMSAAHAAMGQDEICSLLYSIAKTCAMGLSLKKKLKDNHDTIEGQGLDIDAAIEELTPKNKNSTLPHKIKESKEYKELDQPKI